MLNMSQQKLECAIEFYELSRRIEFFMFKNYGVKIRIFKNLQQAVSADSKLLKNHLSSLKIRLSTYLEVAKEKHSTHLTQLNLLEKKISGLEFHNIKESKNLQPEDLHTLSEILDDLIGMVQFLSLQGYEPTAYNPALLSWMTLNNKKQLHQTHLLVKKQKISLQR